MRIASSGDVHCLPSLVSLARLSLGAQTPSWSNTARGPSALLVVVVIISPPRVLLLEAKCGFALLYFSRMSSIVSSLPFLADPFFPPPPLPLSPLVLARSSRPRFLGHTLPISSPTSSHVM